MTPVVPHGHVTAFFLFDVGDAVDLTRVAAQIDASVATPLATKPATPTYLQYQQPPLTFDSALFGLPQVEGCRARVKAYDYGVLSIALTRPLPESWEGMLAAGLEWQDNPRLAQAAERLCRDVLTHIGEAVSRPRQTFLAEDYVVFTLLTDAESEPADSSPPVHTIEGLVTRIKAEYIEVPGLQLTSWQAQRLWGLEPVQCDAILGALVDAAFLRRTKNGSYIRVGQSL